MAAPRVDMHRLQEMVRLHRLGRSSRQVARQLGMGRDTHRQYLRVLAAAGFLAGSPDELPPIEVLLALTSTTLPARSAPQQASSAEPFRATIEELLDHGAGPRAIFDRLRLDDPEQTPSLSAIKRFCVRLKKQTGVRAEDVAIPVETEPGEVAQVDFGYVGKLFDPALGVMRRAWVFVMTLGHSRHMFARIVFDQRIETWLHLHVLAFRFFGGVPRVIVPDNLRSAITRAAFSPSTDVELNRSYRELARHFGFVIDPTPPRSPEKKGKVESAVKYVKGNFVPTNRELDVVTVNAALARWVLEIAGTRIHGTTGRRPLEVFEAEEKAALLSLPAEPFEPAIWRRAKVHPDSHVAFERRLYSVPWRHIGKHVLLRATPATVAIYVDDERVATHARRGAKPRSTHEEHLPEHRRDLRHRGRAYWERRAAVLGPNVARYVGEVFDSDRQLSQLRVVQAAVTHLETFPASRADAACARALAFGNLTYGGLKTILRRALDREPLPEALAGEPTTSRSTPRYARRVGEILFPNLENPHGHDR